MIKRGSPHFRKKTRGELCTQTGAVPLNLPWGKNGQNYWGCVAVSLCPNLWRLQPWFLPSWQVFLGSNSHPHDGSATGSWWGPVPSQERMKCDPWAPPRSTTALSGISFWQCACAGFFTNIHRKPYSPGILGWWTRLSDDSQHVV